MEIELATQRANCPKGEQLKSRLATHAKATGCDELNAAAAYVTVEGVSSVMEALDDSILKTSRWLVGLDDAISQPGAIEKIQSLPNATLRVVTFAATGARFHTKMIHLATSKNPKTATLMVGSANISRAAFERNAEAAAFVTSDDKVTAEWLRATFEKVWKLGHPPTKAELTAYKDRYEAAQKLRKKLDEITSGTKQKVNVVTAPDQAQLDPSLAKTCWIECGAVTLQGKELELKGIQARFFGLNPAGGTGAKITLISSDGEKHPTSFNYRAKTGMWRVLFPSSIKEVKAGLRPKRPDGSLARSPFVAVFEKAASGSFKLTFLDEQSAAYDVLKEHSEESGAIGHTTARSFGWF